MLGCGDGGIHGLNRWGIYGLNWRGIYDLNGWSCYKQVTCFFLGVMLQGNTVSSHCMTTGFGLFDLLTCGVASLPT